MGDLFLYKIGDLFFLPLFEFPTTVPALPWHLEYQLSNSRNSILILILKPNDE